MNQQANQPAAKLDLRNDMPETAKWVDAKRKEHGAEFVNTCIRRAMKGEPGYFYAMEAGHVLGTPWPAANPVGQYHQCYFTMGGTFAGFLADPSTSITPGANNETA